MSSANISCQSATCLFTLLMMSFMQQKFLILVKVAYPFFISLIVLLVLYLKIITQPRVIFFFFFFNADYVSESIFSSWQLVCQLLIQQCLNCGRSSVLLSLVAVPVLCQPTELELPDCGNGSSTREGLVLQCD